MNRPLVITDCDEVLLHMVAPFRDWLRAQHGIVFAMNGGDFGDALRYANSGEVVGVEEVWRLLNAFFDGEMHRQFPIPGAVEAIGALMRRSDVVVLTNLLDHRQESRRSQLIGHGIDVPVFTNQGPKGPKIRDIIAAYQPSHTFFIDDLAQHHGSAAQTTPDITRLHLCGEPLLAPHIACAHQAGHAHARIDDWTLALPWLLERL